MKSSLKNYLQNKKFMYKNIQKIGYFVIFLLPFMQNAQKKLEGKITDKNNLPIEGANIQWLQTTIGTITNAKGEFKISLIDSSKKLIISYVGFKTDTLSITSTKKLVHQLKNQSDLKEVIVKKGKESLQKSYFKSQNIVTVNKSELLKAACCNLAESFETNPSIDVTVSDALSGTKQIEMLGLKSPYLLISQEGIPSIRGAARAYGLGFIPGTWINSIAITKGVGSVVSGYESISGQINTNLVTPNNDKPLFLNAYGAINGRLELNVHGNTPLDKNWSTGLYIHGSIRNKKIDNNADSFLDIPLTKQLNILNRWQYTNPKRGLVGGIGIKYVNDKKQIGQLAFNPNIDQGTTNNWGSEIDTKRLETNGNIGYVFKDLPFQSMGIQLAYSQHQQNSYFGLKNYDIAHQSFYSNFLFSSIIGDTRNKFNTGLNFTYDDYDEKVLQNSYKRTERHIGTFFEYSYDNIDTFSFSAGIRFDHHNLLGNFFTPRLHMRYTPWEKAALKLSAGKGKKSPSIFAENQQLFSTQREIVIDDQKGSFYGLNPETAWNYGISFLQGFYLWNQKGNIGIDYYQTHFKNQLVLDWEDARTISFYNLEGKTNVGNLQIELYYNIAKYLNIRTAYKNYDVLIDYKSGRNIYPLQPKHRFFVNASYEKHMKKNNRIWKLDFTYNWLGSQRLPKNINQNTIAGNIFANPFGKVNMQITKVFSSNFEVYIGGENINNYQQSNPIVNADNPFEVGFDASILYGPVLGSIYYAGLRFTIGHL